MVFKTTKGLSIGSLITGIILLVILFNVASVALPDVNTAGATLNATGVPFGSFFATNGLIMLGVMAGIVLAVFGALGFGGRKR